MVGTTEDRNTFKVSEMPSLRYRRSRDHLVAPRNQGIACY